MIKTIVIIILGLGFVAVVIFLDVPGVESVLAKRKEIENQKQVLIDKQDLLARVEKLTKLYEENKDNVEKTNFILPSSEEIPNLLVQLEALAFEQGLVLGKVDLSTAKKEEPAQGIEGQQRVIQDYETMIINIGLTGTYEGLKSFLKATEENIRLMDVDSINFGSAPQAEEYEGPQMFNFNIIINAYYQ